MIRTFPSALIVCWLLSPLALAAGPPKAIAVWPPDPLEARVAFDKPLANGSVRGMVDRKISFTKGDVKGEMRIAAARLEDQGKTLVLATDPHPFDGQYQLMLIGLRGSEEGSKTFKLALSYSLGGVQVGWDDGSQDAKPKAFGWWPELDSQIPARRAIAAPNASLGDHIIDRPGRLTLRTLVRLPAGQTALRIQTNRPTEAEIAGASASGDGKTATLELAVEATGDPLELEVRIKTSAGATPLKLVVEWKTKADRDFKPIPRSALLLPWAPSSPTPSGLDLAKPDPKTLAGGDVTKGALVFKSDAAKCSACHMYAGQGGKVGPDLKNQVGRDLALVYQDLAQPSLAIHPEYVAYTVALADGQVATGIVRAQGGDAVRVIDTNAREQIIPRSAIEELRPSSSSIMPAGLVGAIGEENIRHLLAYLTTAPQAVVRPGPPKEGPPLHSRAEVEAVIGKRNGKINTSTSKAMSILLVAGAKPFGPNDHPYAKWTESWGKALGSSPKIRIDRAIEWPTPEQWAKADVAVLYFWSHDWSPDKLNQIDAFLKRGGGLVVLHSAMVTDGQADDLASRFGFGVTTKKRKFLHGQHDLSFAQQLDDPIIDRLPPLHLADEAYWEMTNAGDGSVQVLATAVEEGKSWPVVWKREVGKGRVFATVFGHYSWTLDDPLFRVLVCRGIAWSGHDPDIHRWDKPAVEGVSIKE